MSEVRAAIAAGYLAMEKRIEELEADLRTSINLREQTDMQLARTQNLLGKKVAELAALRADLEVATVFNQEQVRQLAELRELACNLYTLAKHCPANKIADDFDFCTPLGHAEALLQERGDEQTKPSGR